MQTNSNRQYYCYNCCQQFEEIQAKQTCKFCNSEAIEEIQNQNSSNSNGEQFQVYQIPSQNNQTNSPTNQIPNRQNNAISAINILESLTNGSGLSNLVTSLAIGPSMSYVSLGFNGNNSPLQQFGFGNQFFNLLRGLRFGESISTRPTSQQINKLQTINCVKECSICQEGQSQGQHEQLNQQKYGYKLPCNHQFHKSCIAPWFQQTNTCPTCRQTLE